MGAWGHGPFDNDDASDWIYELEESEDGAVIEAALGKIAHASGYLEAPDCSNALAAAEVVAALRGKPIESLPDTAREWIGGRKAPTSEWLALARQALKKIRAKSELRELWEESDEFAQWNASLEGLESRLS